MNPRHLSAFVWLRRRLLVNQLRRNGLGNQIILLLAFVSLALGAAGLFVGGVALGASALPAAPPVGRLLAWDGLVAGFLFVRAMGEVHAMLDSIRNGREHIRAATSERLAHTNLKLDEVSSATATAAIDIMDALDRAIAKVDELETEEVVADADKATAIRGDLRDELFAVMGHMQFQDITSQQIMHVQSLLGEMEQRLSDIANLYDAQSGDQSASATASQIAQRAHRDGHSFDPNATLADAETRQALADELVERGSAGA